MTSPRRRAPSTSTRWPPTSRRTPTPRSAWRPSSLTGPTAWCSGTKATGYKIPQSQIQILDTGLIYTETSDGKCDFGEVFTTDGRIQALNLELVEDPGAMILYNLSFTFNDAVYKKNAKVYDELADTIFKDLDEEKMAELNAQVDVEGMSAQQVAQKYLEDIGVL